MPLVTMATPITSSEIYLLPDPDPIPTRTRIRKRDKRELVFNIFQLGLQCFLITLYSMGAHQVTILAGDAVISAFFGASVMFTLLKIFHEQTDRNKVFLNIMFGVIQIIIALILIPIIMMLQDTLLDSKAKEAKEYEDILYYINLKLTSGIVCFILGVMCFVEAIYVTLNNI